MNGRVGIGRIGITPQRPGAPAGWSVAGPFQVGGLCEGAPELVATALALGDGRGEPVVIVFADLHCGGAALWRALSEETGVPCERLILAGTHTHAGPGHIYGSVLYNLMTTPVHLPWPARARRLARAIAPAVRQAVQGMVDGDLCVVRVPRFGFSSNRAVPAALRLPLDEVGAFRKVGPGAGGPPRPLADQLCDPRITTLIVRDAGGRPFGALATAAVHGTACGPEHAHWSADWAGPARVRAERALAGVIVGLAGGASGDVSPLPIDEEGQVRTSALGDRPNTQGTELAEAVGHIVADGIIEAVGAAADPRGAAVGVAFSSWRPADDPELGEPITGLATAAGGIDGVTSPEAWALLGAGVKSDGYARHADRALKPPHHPKVPIQHARNLGVLPLDRLTRALGPRELPLHAVAVGDLTIVTVPGEPTTFVAWRIERAVREAVGGSVLVLGYAGDYAGYWVTPEAYDQQRYEGASTLFGRQASAVLQRELVGLARRARYAATDPPADGTS